MRARITTTMDPTSKLSALLLIAVLFAPLSTVARAQAPMSAPCTTTVISKIVMPSGPARYQAGRMTLGNGAILELAAARSDPAMYAVSQMRVGDRVAACYGHPQTYADAGQVRTITILDLRNGQYFGTLVGTWKR